MSHGALHLATALSVAIVLAAGAAALLVPRRLQRATGPVGLAHLAGAALAMTPALFATCLVALPFGLEYFGILRLLYVAGVVTLPLGGLLLLAAARRLPLTPAARAVAVTTFAAAACGMYATFVEPYQVRFERAEVEVPARRRGSEPLRIGVLADIQTFRVGAHEHAAVDRLMAERPDLVLLPGDFIHPCHVGERAAALPGLRALLAKVEAPYGAYAVVGDVEAPQQLRDMLAGTPVTPLVNETVRIEVKGRLVTIAGLDSGDARVAQDRFLRRSQDAPGEDDVRILMTHRPDPLLRLDRASRIDLVVAGHTHGGQVVIPFLGPPITLSRAPRHVCAGGLHEVDGNRIYVSRGLGWEHGQAPRIRFLAPPEITLLEVR